MITSREVAAMDKRNERTRAVLKDALVDSLKKKRLADVSVSELCLAAAVSRSTFYSNYQNVSNVFRALVEDFAKETRSVNVQIHCRKCREEVDGKLPYCIAVRTTVRYGDVVREDCFLPLYLDALEFDSTRSQFLNPFLELGLSPEVASNVMRFQMAGCHAAALREPDDAIWLETQERIDAFIAGGLNALRAR